MKNGINNGKKGGYMFGIVLLAIILLIIFACLFGWFCWKSKNTESFIDEQYFHYDNIGKLIPTDPPHVNREVLEDALLDGEEIDSYSRSGKKKTIQ
jgi:predicted negative regulator of RcsB-dependent stress response